MENSGTSGGVNDAKTATTITLNIKFSGRSIPVSVSPNSTVKDLKSLLQPLTNVLTRGQKLIFKGLFPLYKSRNPRYFLKKQTRGRNWFLMVSVCAGRVLADGMTLRESEITDGAKVMLMASQGLHQGVSSLFFFFLFYFFFCFLALRNLNRIELGVWFRKMQRERGKMIDSRFNWKIRFLISILGLIL